MGGLFRILVTSHCEREVRDLLSSNPELTVSFEKLKTILQKDPLNTTRQFPIKKLKGVKPGQGRWRIRTGSYRLRYDVFGKDVVLYSFRHRKESY